MSGEEIEGAPRMFIGAAANPFADPFAFRVIRLAQEGAAGVDFIQTQCIYNMDKFRAWMQSVVDRGLHEKVHILAGVTPLKIVGMARYMKNTCPAWKCPMRSSSGCRTLARRKRRHGGHQHLRGADPASSRRSPAVHGDSPDGHRVGGEGSRDREGGRSLPETRGVNANPWFRPRPRPVDQEQGDRIGCPTPRRPLGSLASNLI